MSSPDPKDYRGWDRLFDFLHACDESPTEAEIDADLQRADIDMQRANRRLREMVAAKQAQLALTRAKSERAGLVERLRNTVGPPVERIRASLQAAIEQLGGGPEQLAYYHKLEKAASDADLQSLKDDLERLNLLRHPGEENAPPSE